MLALLSICQDAIVAHVFEPPPDVFWEIRNPSRDGIPRWDRLREIKRSSEARAERGVADGGAAGALLAPKPKAEAGGTTPVVAGWGGKGKGFRGFLFPVLGGRGGGGWGVGTLLFGVLPVVAGGGGRWGGWDGAGLSGCFFSSHSGGSLLFVWFAGARDGRGEKWLTPRALKGPTPGIRPQSLPLAPSASVAMGFLGLGRPSHVVFVSGRSHDFYDCFGRGWGGWGVEGIKIRKIG